MAEFQYSICADIRLILPIGIWGEGGVYPLLITCCTGKIFKMFGRS